MDSNIAARVLAPVDREEEVELLVQAGADELYAGVQPSAWLGRAVSANQRTFASAQFADEASFARAASVARRLGAPLHLALNGPLYDPTDYPDLLGLAERAVSWGVDGLIAGDLGLLVRISRAGLPLRLTLSTMAGALNQEAIVFYRRFGVERVVLPRHATLGEMEALVRAHPELVFEAFVLVGRCPNEEGYCTFQHTSSAKRWPCEIPYELTEIDGGPVPEDHPLAAWQGSWNGADRRLACGLCAIPELLLAGVRVLKIVGRGSPSAAKVANVELVKGFLGEPRTREEALAAYEARFGRPCHLLTCYFPELHPGRVTSREI